MAAPIIYRSDDPNAPVLNGSDRTCVVNLLKACLVDGYGDKPGAGWTMPFVSADGRIAAFRNNPVNGTGFFLSVNHASPSGSNMCRFYGYEVMTSENDGSFSFGYKDGIVMSASLSTAARAWILAATDTWFYFFGYNGLSTIPTNTELISAGSAGNGPIVVFGDFEKLAQLDGYNCMLMQNSRGSAVIFGYNVSSSASSSPGCFLARKESDVAGQVEVAVHVPPPAKGGTGMGGFGVPYPGKMGLLTSKAIINNGSEGTIRGFLPGILVPLSPLPFDNLQLVSLLDGHDYVAVSFKPLISSAAESCGQFLFDMGPTPYMGPTP